MFLEPGTYITHTGKAIRYNGFGHIVPMRYDDLESLVSKYRNYFETLQIRILDDEAINLLYLREYYNKYDISKEELENIITLEPQQMISKITSLTQSLQETAVSLIIKGISENDSKFLDMNKWAVIENHFNIKINDLVDQYKI